MMMIPRVLKRSRPYSSKVDTKLLNLPRDILIDIVLRLPLKLVCSIQCVSKMLFNIVDKEFVEQYTRGQNAALPTGHPVPQLMLLARSYDGNNKETKTFHTRQYPNALNIEEDGSQIIVSQKYTYEVHCVFSNLICFKDVSYGGPSFLLDPLKRQVLGLPASEAPTLAYIRCRRRSRRELFDWLAMGFDDTTGKHKIVRVCGNSRYKNLVAQVLELGTSSWRVIPAFPPCNLSHKNASACGDMHWVIATEPRPRGESNIISFDFKKEEFYWTRHPTLRSAGQRTCDLNLVNLRGCLAIVDVLHDFMDIWVLKNYKQKEWVLEYCIEFPFKISIGQVMGRCGEWEHGIFFKATISTGVRNGATAMFLDLKGGTDEVPVLELMNFPMLNWTIISYTGSLISLKHYGNLVEAEACDKYPELKQLGFSDK